MWLESNVSLARALYTVWKGNSKEGNNEIPIPDNPLLKKALDDKTSLIKKSTKSTDDFIQEHKIGILYSFISDVKWDITEKELSDLLKKIDLVFNNDIEWRKKFYITLSLLLNIEKKFSGKPFYIDEKWNIRVAIRNNLDYSLFKNIDLDLPFIWLNKENFVSHINNIFNNVEKLADLSTWEMK
jgi:hypothetical protein